jgi:NAD(P)-dependent dehydrogenase (short-subunit alcohol dehydrogenase family)
MIIAEGGRAYAIEADVAEKDDCERIFEVAMTTSGRVDGMVYSVAMNPPFDFESNSMTVENFNYGVDVNMLGCYYCNLSAAQCMAKNSGDTTGSIVNISSIASVKNELGLNIGIMPYALGKCGLNQITELTAVQYAGAGIRVNTLMLGPISSVLGNHDSRSLFGFDPSEAEDAYNEVVKLKMGRGSVWESAYAAVYLLADESRFMTGQQIRLDGGATLVR